MKILLTTLILLTMFPTYSHGKWFGSDTYEECLLDEDVKDAKTKEGVRAIEKACSIRHPEYKWKHNLLWLRVQADKSYSSYSDCELIKAVKRGTDFTDEILIDRYGINPSTCD